MVRPISQATSYLFRTMKEFEEVVFNLAWDDSTYFDVGEFTPAEGAELDAQIVLNRPQFEID